MRLSDSDLQSLAQSFAENGYAVVRQVVPRDGLGQLHGRIIDAYEQAKTSGALFSGGGSITGHLNCFPGEASRFAYQSLEDRGIIELATKIMNVPGGKLHVGANLNLPGSVTQHYNVDSSFLESFAIVNVAVVDTDLVNGAIDVAPGTNRRFYKYWRFAVERPHKNYARVPLSIGDVLLRPSTLWHRGMPNRSKAPRPMLAFTIGDIRAAVPDGDPFSAHGGNVTFYPNWYRTDFLGRLRERTFVAAPITYSAYRFVRSLVGNKGYATP